MDGGPVSREVVIPGEAIGGRGLRPGPGTYADRGTIVAATLGLRSESGGVVSVIPIAGQYMPQSGDAVIGRVEDIGPSFWLVDIKAPYPAPLHATETPWTVEFGEAAQYLRVGDTIAAGVLSVDERKRIQLTMQDPALQKLDGGQLVEISHTNVARVVGSNGSMIELIKGFTRVQVLVGQNGRIWMEGAPGDMVHAARAISMIDERAQAIGLTDAVRAYFESVYGPRPAGEDPPS